MLGSTIRIRQGKCTFRNSQRRPEVLWWAEPWIQPIRGKESGMKKFEEEANAEMKEEQNEAEEDRKNGADEGGRIDRKNEAEVGQNEETEKYFQERYNKHRI